MKKFRIILSMTAMVLAVGGAFASKTLQNPVYEWKSATSTCQSVAINCFISGSSPCRVDIDSPQLRQNNSASTSCGALMYFR